MTEGVIMKRTRPAPRSIPMGDHWRFIGPNLVTCLGDGTVTLNAKVILTVSPDGAPAEAVKRVLEVVPELFDIAHRLIKGQQGIEVMERAERALIKIGGGMPSSEILKG